MKTTSNKVLIPIDGSEFSLQVLPFATRFLAPEKCELILLHVDHEPSMVLVGDIVYPDAVIYADQEAASLEAAFRAAMQPYLHKLANAGFQVMTAIRFGKPTAEIERFIAEEHTDLVVMSTHGRTGLARTLLGSVAQHVVKHANVPVLLFRPSSEATMEEQTLTHFLYAPAN